MKKIVIGMLACFSLVAASPSFASANEEAAQVIIDSYKSGAITEMDARELINPAATPYEVAQFAGWLMKQLYNGGKWLTVNGYKTGKSTVLCVAYSLYESGALGKCSVTALGQGSDALEACWAKAFSSASWKNQCVSESAPAAE